MEFPNFEITIRFSGFLGKKLQRAVRFLSADVQKFSGTSRTNRFFLIFKAFSDRRQID